jgi:DNA replication protein DnaC
MATPAVHLAIPAAVNNTVSILSACENFASRFASSLTLEQEIRDAGDLASDTIRGARSRLRGLRGLRELAMADEQRNDLEQKLKHMKRKADEVTATSSRSASWWQCGSLWERAAGALCHKYREVQLSCLQSAITALKEASDAIQVDEFIITQTWSALYQPPRQFDQVLDALEGHGDLVMVTGGPALGKSALARAIMSQITAQHEVSAHMFEYRMLVKGTRGSQATFLCGAVW